MSDDASRKKKWLEARRKLITSTDVAAIMGLPGAYGSPMGVYLSKTQPIEDEDESDTPEFMEWGNRLQRAILDGYAVKTGISIHHVDPFTVFPLVRNPVLGASFDAMQQNAVVPVDAKNVGFRDPEQWGEDNTGDIPARYVIQLHVQMMVADATHADLAALFGGRKLGVFRIDYDREVAAGIEEAATRFWNEHVLADVPPPVDASPEWTRFLASRRQSTQRILVAPPDIQEHLRVLARARAEREVAEGIIAERENLIKAFIADNQGLEAPGFKVTYKQRKDSTTVDWKAIAMAMKGQVVPEIFDAMVKEHTTTKPGARVFLFKQPGTEKETPDE